MRVGVGRLVTVVRRVSARRKIDVVVRPIMHVAENRAPDLHFGDAGLLDAVRERPCAAAADDRDAMAIRDARPGACSKRCDRLAHRALLFVRIGDRRGLALPARDADEAQAPAPRDLVRQFNHRAPRHDARPIHADVDFDRHAQRLARVRERGVELDDVVDAVDANDRIGALCERHQPRDLRRPDDLVRNQDVVDARGCHDLRFAQLRTRDADGARGDLHLRDLGCLVRLGMRPPRNAVRATRGGDAGDVSFHHVEVDQERRRVE